MEGSVLKVIGFKTRSTFCFEGILIRFFLHSCSSTEIFVKKDLSDVNIECFSLKLKTGRIDFMHSMGQAVKQQEYHHKELQKVCHEQ